VGIGRPCYDHFTFTIELLTGVTVGKFPVTVERLTVGKEIQSGLLFKCKSYGTVDSGFVFIPKHPV